MVGGTLAGAELSGDGLDMAEEWTVLACEVKLVRLGCREISWETEESNIADGLQISLSSLVDLNPARLAASVDGTAFPFAPVPLSQDGAHRTKLSVQFPPLCRSLALASCLRVFLGLGPFSGEGVPSEV